MDDMTLIMIMVGITVAMLIAGVALAINKSSGAKAEERLEGLTANRRKTKAKASAEGLLRPPAINQEQMAMLRRYLPSADGLQQLYEQADMDLDFSKFLLLIGALGLGGGLLGFFLLPLVLAPVGLLLGGLPFLFLLHRKKKRTKQFLEAMPEAVELMGRALRAGHGLASGMQLVSQEMSGPIADEFGRVFEEQNLGIPMDVALRGMSDRIPSMDVRFLVTAIVIQRATGGDLAEVLDKIGRLIRQRFELFGHVKGLTAEGRLSGVVLMALPPGLLGFLSVTNYKYVASLFTTELGNKMLVATAIMQVLGALSIKKIVAIKV